MQISTEPDFARLETPKFIYTQERKQQVISEMLSPLQQRQQIRDFQRQLQESCGEVCSDSLQGENRAVERVKLQDILAKQQELEVLASQKAEGALRFEKDAQTEPLQ